MPVDAHNLKRVFVMTRGRTGSSAIVDELGATPATYSAQEIFTQATEPYEGDVFPNFEVWKRQIPATDRGDEQLAAEYLDLLDQAAVSSGAQALFIKALTVHFHQRPYLKALFKARGYRALYLKRSPTRQTLSGLLARERQLYNTRDPGYRDERRYVIDVAEFRELVKYEVMGFRSETEALRAEGFDFIEITYEDYVADRAAFFGRVFRFLGLPEVTPQPSGFQIMIDDPRARVENYDEVAAVAAQIGAPL